MSAPLHDLAIIGAGPGGLAAARAAAGRGLSVVVLDEQAAPGGQIWRQPPPVLAAGQRQFGASYAAGVARAQAAAQLPGVEWRQGSAVWSVQTPVQSGDEVFRISTTGPAGLDEVAARRLIVATGCYDMPVPFPGWTLPGVMGAGAIQALMKGQRVIPGQRVVLAGAHPLLLIVAEQMLAFGQPPVAVIFAQHPGRALGLLRQPLLALRFAPLLLQAARALLRLLHAGVPLRFGRVVTAAQGEGQLSGVEIARPADPGRHEVLACDTLGVGFGFTPATEVARLAGAGLRWLPLAGGWVVAHDAGMRSTVPGLYVAGEIAGIGGAHTAEAEGRLAALSALADAGQAVTVPEMRRAQAARRRSRRFAGLLARLADPGAALLHSLRDADTILCRCEELTLGDLQRMLAENPFLGSGDALKLLARPGMGACQGRYCGASIAETIATATGQDPGTIAPTRVRAPLKPVPLVQFRLPPGD